MTLAAVVLAAVVALPLGLWLGRTGRGDTLVGAVNLTRALPTLALLYIFTAGLGVGQTPTILAVAVFAVPPILANTVTGLRAVDPAARDAGLGMGMSPARLLTAVEPAAGAAAGRRRGAHRRRPGDRDRLLAALAGGGGLGLVITNGIFTQRFGQALAGALLVVVVCLAVEGLLALAQRALTPAPLRVTAAGRAA